MTQGRGDNDGLQVRGARPEKGVCAGWGLVGAKPLEGRGQRWQGSEGWGAGTGELRVEKGREKSPQHCPSGAE